MSEERGNRKTLTGIVVSDTMDKTVVVAWNGWSAIPSTTRR
jgi:ribosomal protein S17